MKFADLESEWAQVLRGLEALQQVEAHFEQKRFLLRSQLTDEASAALRAPGSGHRPRCTSYRNPGAPRKCSAKAFWRFYKCFIPSNLRF
jgi:hypothetical protein